MNDVAKIHFPPMPSNQNDPSPLRIGPVRASELDHLVEACVVRSGTSRIIVVDGRTLPPHMDPSEIADHLLGRGDLADGLGGEHYQLNKVAIWSASSEDVAEFHFFNLDPTLKTITVGSECGHAAAAVGMVAAVSEPRRFNSISVPVHSLDTGQRFEYRSHDAGRCWNAPCTLRLFPEASPPAIHSKVAAQDHREDIPFDVVHHGNSFALVPGISGLESAKIRRQIALSTVEMARRDRRTNDRPEYVRVLPYEIEWLSDTTATVTATCFNGEVRHKSLPISGAIALCDLLALKRVDEFPPPGDPQRMRFEFELQSPHGTKPGNVELVRRDDSWMVDWTGYDADVRLLFACNAVIPLPKGR